MVERLIIKRFKQLFFNFLREKDKILKSKMENSWSTFYTVKEITSRDRRNKWLGGILPWAIGQRSLQDMCYLSNHLGNAFSSKTRLHFVRSPI